MAGRGMRTVATSIGLAFLLVTGCSSNSDEDVAVTIEPASAAQSPPQNTVPAGTVHPVGAPIASTTFDAETRTAVVMPDSDNQILLFSGDDLAAPTRAIPVDQSVTQVSIAPGGVALLAMNNQVGRLDLRTGELTFIPADGDVRSVAQLPDGRIATGLSDGKIHIEDPETNRTQVIDGLTSVDELAVVGDTLTALDRGQTSITAIDVPDSSLGLALRAGEGATQLTTDHFGRILVTDTRGDELLVYTTDALILRQRFPTGPAPYGVAYDDRSDTAWVTLTGDNEVVGFDLSSGVGVETARYSTVRQPNSIAVDTVNGDLLIGSATGDGLQQIPTRSP
ncbi:hypothetical protein BFN03_08535 [Rhodococcus sp. WMMA185]|uniref:YncE family protein n=1 Tax=Rhodococcus sp. WMMA185 TaxID=679318 RepID=UPI00087898E9|nr:hypothetical protein [Rhodococcus sp. WMMA185]AOW92728.1 hypothetical protein BFN03_08535 [Rhodococcus sp. WMMA185]